MHTLQCMNSFKARLVAIGGFTRVNWCGAKNNLCILHEHPHSSTAIRSNVRKPLSKIQLFIFVQITHARISPKYAKVFKNLKF